MTNDWGRPFTPEELEKLAAEKAEPVIKPTLPAYIQQVGRAVRSAPDIPPVIVDVAESWTLKPAQSNPWPEPVKPTMHDNPTCYAWHPESGCGIIFSDRDALNQALEAEPLLVEMTKEEYDEATKVRAADWGSEPAFVGGTMTGRKDWSIPDINGDAWPTHPDQLSPMTVEQQEPEPRTAPVETYSEADGPWYVVYFGPVLYTVLAGPYETEEAAAGRLDTVWGQFEHDAAYDFTFPVRERSGLRAATVRTVYNLKGAYGKQ